MDSTSLLSLARKRALEKKKNRANDEQNSDTSSNISHAPTTSSNISLSGSDKDVSSSSNISHTPSTASNVARPGVDEQVPSSNNSHTPSTASNVTLPAADKEVPSSNNSLTAKEQASSLLERARARLTSFPKSQTASANSPPNTELSLRNMRESMKDRSTFEDLSAGKEELSGGKKDLSAGKEVKSGQDRRVMNLKRKKEEKKTPLNTSGLAPPLPFSFSSQSSPPESSAVVYKPPENASAEETEQHAHSDYAKWIDHVIKSIPKGNNSFEIDTMSSAMTKGTFGLSSEKMNAIAEIVNDLEVCVVNSVASSELTIVLNKLLSVLIEDDIDTNKIPLAVGASGACQLIVQNLTKLCQQERSIAEKTMMLSLECIVHTMKVGRTVLTENLEIFAETPLLNCFNAIYNKYATTCTGIMMGLLDVMEIMVCVDSENIAKDKMLLETLIVYGNQEGVVASRSFGILTTLSSNVESCISVLFSCGFLTCICNSLGKSMMPEYRSEELAASACESLFSILLQDTFAKHVLSHPDICDNVVKVYLFFLNSCHRDSCRLLKFSLLCLARLANLSHRFANCLLRDTSSNILDALWISLLQYKGHTDILGAIVNLGVVLTKRILDLQHQTNEYLHEVFIPRYIFDCIKNVSSSCSSISDLGTTVCLLLLNIIRIADIYQWYFIEHHRICPQVCEIFEELLLRTNNQIDYEEYGSDIALNKLMLSYFMGAVSFLSRSNVLNQRQMRNTRIGIILEKSLVDLWVFDAEVHLLALNALANLYPVQDSPDDICLASEASLVLSCRTLSHVLDIVAGKKKSSILSVTDRFLNTELSGCDEKNAVSALLVTFSHFKNCSEVFDEKVCVLLLEVLRERNKISSEACVNLLRFFRNVLLSDNSSIQFLEASAMKFVFDILSGPSLNVLVFEASCYFLNDVIQSCKKKDRKVDIHYNTFFMKNVIRCCLDISSSDLSLFQCVARVFEELTLETSELSEADSLELLHFVLAMIKKYHRNASTFCVIANLKHLLGIAFRASSVSNCDGLCEICAVTMSGFVDDIDACAEVLGFLSSVSSCCEWFAKAFAESDGIFSVMHSLNIDGEKSSKRLIYLRNALAFLNSVCLEKNYLIIC